MLTLSYLLIGFDKCFCKLGEVFSFLLGRIIIKTARMELEMVFPVLWLQGSDDFQLVIQIDSEWKFFRQIFLYF